MSQPLGKERGCIVLYSVIRLEIIDLLLENNRPEIFAKEFDNVEIVGKARSVSREARQSMVSYAVSEMLV
jgi:hypothetical protein